LQHRTDFIYCFLLPFGLVDNLRWLTPFIVVFIAYTFVAFEAIADEIEEPFGTEDNDLALANMCQLIESTYSNWQARVLTRCRNLVKGLLIKVISFTHLAFK
jgi:predicted membrane chloride channel (bestrophin family)